MKLRPVQTADFTTLASWVPDAHACARWGGPDLPFPFNAEDLPRLLNTAQGPSFCLCDESEEILGFAQYFDKGDAVVRLARIILAPHQRGLGLAKTLCQLLMQQAQQEMPIASFSLAVYRDNLPALSCYRQLGFVVDEEKSSSSRLEMRLVR